MGLVAWTGIRGLNPLWAPAYVSFFGWGGGFGFGVGFGGWGGFGWLPVGPCDYFHPWWGGYRGRFGVVNVYNIHNNYRYGGIRPLHGGNRYSNIANLHNDHVGRALSTVNAGHFGAGRVTAVPASRAQIRGARMMAGNLPVVPSRASLSASGRAAAPSTVRNGGSQRFFGSHNNMARPVSFQQQTASLRQTMQRSHVGAIPAGGRVNTSPSAGFRGSTAGSNLQRPSAGTPSNRGTVNQPSSVQNGGRYRPFNPPASNSRPSNLGNSERMSAGNSNPRGGGSSTMPSARGMRQPPAGNSGGFRPFAPPSGNSRSSGWSSGQGPTSGMNSRTMGAQRGTSQPPVNNGGGFRPFSPPSHNDVSRGPSSAPSSPRSNSNSSNYWNRTAPTSVQPRGSSSYPNNYGRGSSSRPQLDMRQPIVRPPSNNGTPRGSYPSAPRSSGPELQCAAVCSKLRRTRLRFAALRAEL